MYSKYTVVLKDIVLKLNFTDTNISNVRGGEERSKQTTSSYIGQTNENKTKPKQTSWILAIILSYIFLIICYHTPFPFIYSGMSSLAKYIPVPVKMIIISHKTVSIFTISGLHFKLTFPRGCMY